VAVSAAGTTLTAQHRLQQLTLRQATVSDLLRLWRAFDPSDLNGSWVALEPALVALTQARRPVSSNLAAEYVTGFRRAEQVAGSVRPAFAPSLTADDIIPNLRYVGPGNALRMVQLGRPLDDIARVTLVNVEGEVTRQVLGGGRQTILDTVRRDPQARGYIRVTDGSPCAFCAMLAGRGPVYRSADTGSFDAHRACGCTAEPVYRTDQPWPRSAERFRDLYREAAKAVPKSTSDWSAEVRREFRRRYERTA
jgi:hypothetical protein